MDFEDIETRTKELEASYTERNTMFEELEKMYLLEADDLPDEDWVKDTISSDPRNSVLGAKRLLSAAEPKWAVPVSTNNPKAKRVASRLERFAAAAWTAIGRLNNEPIHYDAALSAVLYGELHLAVTLVSDLEKTAKTPAAKRQVENAKKQTPFLIEVINPAMGFPVWGKLGLREYASVREMMVSEVRERWGDGVLIDKKPTDKVKLYDYWDLEIHAAWVDGEDQPLINAPHNLPMIPIVAVLAEGSRLFWRPQQQTRQPMLYTYWKSNLWKRQNLALTIMFSLTFAIGSNPLFVWKRSDPSKKAPPRDHSVPGGLVVLDQNEEFFSLANRTLDPSLMTSLQTAKTEAEEATIYKQTLGEPLGGNAPFSMVSMLSQAGRLPLTSYQRMASFAIGKAMLTGLAMVKMLDGGSLTALGEKGTETINAADIPDNLDLEANLDISMPQDERLMVAVAAQATGGPNPLVSMRHAREAFLNIGQPDEMQSEIMEEQYLTALWQAKMQLYAQQMAAQLQQQQGGALPPGMAGPAGAPGMPQGMPPGPQMPPGQPGMPDLQQTGAAPGLPGMPMGAPVDPRMMPAAPGGPGGPGAGPLPPGLGGM